jgi:3-hydroxybutyryl-CoA dehydrogenase
MNNTTDSGQSIGVVGLGLLGRGIAACLLARGYRVIAVDRESEKIEAARPPLAQMIEELIANGDSPTSLRDDWPQRWQAGTHFEPLRECELVIESVTEALPSKQQVFERIEAVVSAECHLASNTSAIPISVLQQQRRHPQRMVGMHWAEPAHATRFLELIRGELTSEETLQYVERFGRQLGKDPVICQKDVPGFIVNRIAYAMYREALHLVESGVADIETIDRSLRNTLGLWAASCGPFRWIDLTGGPMLYERAMQRVLPTLCRDTQPSALMQRMSEECRRGIINGRGFYTYTPEEIRVWEDRQRRHVWRVKQWLDQEFPLE